MIVLPFKLSIFCTQAFAALLSIITVHVPHAPSLHPFFTEVSFKVSLKKGMSLILSVIVYVIPFTVKVDITSPPIQYLIIQCYYLYILYSRDMVSF
ncbi:hypothetical protein SDC9_97023 [bioreactor metagenome]|uniref:Uncharacterized protein n=1 Tax=bioreactor metagenome TaxID=1076179 RepID=A0A645AKT8_9ZZZZ